MPKEISKKPDFDGVIPLEEIISLVDTEGLVTLEDIYKAKLPIFKDNKIRIEYDSDGNPLIVLYDNRRGRMELDVERSLEEFSNRGFINNPNYGGKSFDFGGSPLQRGFHTFTYADIISEDSDCSGIEAILKAAREGFENKVVVELGPGEMPDGYYFAKWGNAKAYVGVEPFYADRLLRRLSLGWLQENQKELKRKGKKNRSYKVREQFLDHESEIPRTVVAEDTLTFLKRLPDNSVSLLAVGLFESAVPGGSNPYTQAVNKEMSRVLHPEGRCISYKSHFQANHEELEFRGPDYERIWRKKQEK